MKSKYLQIIFYSVIFNMTVSVLFAQEVSNEGADDIQLSIVESTPDLVEIEEMEPEVVETEIEEPAISFSGTVDAYFRNSLGDDFTAAPATSFANLPGFSLGMVNLIASHEGDKVGATADLVIGPRGEDATFLSPELRPGGSSNIVNQLYVYYNVSDKLKFTIGNFNTFLGYEVISPADNYNYSTSYMFSYGPFSHTGFKLDYDLGGGFSAMAGVFNPTDATEYNPLNDYAGGFQLGYSKDAFSIYLNSLVSEDFFQFDITAGAELGDVYLGLNTTSASDNFFGVAGYLQYSLSDAFSLGTRVELFTDNGIGVLADDESVIDFTLSANYKVGNLTIIPEFRMDTFSSDTQDLDNLSSVLLACIYSM